MNRAETLAIMSVMKAAYPAFYREMSARDAEAAVSLWCEMFADDPAHIVAMAVKSHIASDRKGYPPNIGSIKEAIRKLTRPDEMSDMEAWGYVSRALRNGIYGYAEEFKKLPPVIRRIVGTPMQLREWAMMDSDTVQSVVMSGFRKSYAARAESEREFLAMPSDVREVMTQIAAGMAFPALGGGR